MNEDTPEDAKSKSQAVLREAGVKALEGIDQARRKGREVISATREKGEELISATREKGEELISATREKGEELISATREKGEELIEDTREKSMRAAAETNRLFQEHPITAVAAAAAAGAVLGIFLPRFNILGKAGALAGQAVKAAATSGIWSNLRNGARPETPETPGDD